MTIYVDALIQHDLTGKSVQVRRVFADGYAPLSFLALGANVAGSAT